MKTRKLWPLVASLLLLGILAFLLLPHSKYWNGQDVSTNSTKLTGPREKNETSSVTNKALPIAPVQQPAAAILAGKIRNPYVSRSAEYKLDIAEIDRCIQALREGESPTVTISLFEHGAKRLRLTKEDALGVNVGNYSVSGSFDGYPGSIGVLANSGGAIAAVAMIPNVGYFRISMVAGKLTGMLEEVTQVGGCGNCDINSALVAGSFRVGFPSGYSVISSPNVQTQMGPDVRVDLCVGVTQDAINIAQSTGIQTDSSSGQGTTNSYSSEAAVAAAISYANAVHRQSGSPIRYRLVSIQSLASVSTSELIAQTIKIMDKADPIYSASRFDSLHREAEHSGADFTVVVRHNLNAAEVNSGIVSYVPRRLSNLKENYDSAKALVCCSIEDLEISLTHELAHLSGCLHNRATAGTPGIGESIMTPNCYGFISPLILGKYYATVMAYVPRGLINGPRYYLPYFSNPLLTLSNGTDAISLGGTLAEPTNNVECLKYSTSAIRAYRDGGTVDDPSVIAFRKIDHWARVELQKCIDLGIMNNQNPTDRVWMNAETPVTRGEMISLLKSAAEKSKSSYFSSSPFVQPPSS